MMWVLWTMLACEPKEELEGCTMEAKYSVNLTLTDADGNPLENAEVSYTVDGVEGQSVVDSWEAGTYAVGIEEAGDFEITVFAEVPFEDDPCCWMIGDTVISVTVEADECHVIPVSISEELGWSTMCADAETAECG